MLFCNVSQSPQVGEAMHCLHRAWTSLTPCGKLIIAVCCGMQHARFALPISRPIHCLEHCAMLLILDNLR